MEISPSDSFNEYSVAERILETPIFIKNCYLEREKLEDQIEELEASLHKKENFYRYISPGYWHVTENSLSRLDNKFIEYYRTHQEPIQEELEFTYVRPPTKEEDKRQEEKQIREEHKHYNTGK